VVFLNGLKFMGKRFYCFIIFMLLCLLPAGATINPAVYGVHLPADSTSTHERLAYLFDSTLDAHPMLATTAVYNDINVPHISRFQTSDFYFVLFICLCLGLIRYIDTKYFSSLWRAFWSPSMSNRQLKDQLEGSGFADMLMNIFFIVVLGVYIYYVGKFFAPHHASVLPVPLLILMLIAAVGVVYIAKYISVKFSGWAFRLDSAMDNYLFNVFLINKILAVALIPFVVILAFMDYYLAQPVMILSVTVVGLLLLNRYVRSWQIFGTFLQFSQFHFFLYLCASELLPLAILMKLLTNGLIYY
jgi:Domain of unknown function (DUF4271)